jgi:hypothetical protein
MLLLPLISNAQTLPIDFAADVFEACKANDEARFREFLASPEDFKIFIKDIDPAVPDNEIAPAYDRYASKALKGFNFWQGMAKELELDFKKAIVTTSEVEDRPIELKRNNNPIKTVNFKVIRIFFTCSGKKLCFIISDAISVNDNYYLGNDHVQLHWVD